MQSSLLLRRAALLALLLLAMWRPREPLAADVLTFDTNGDGVPDLTIPDSDGDGRFEWPAGTTILHGTLHFSAGNDIAFSGYTTIKVDTITIDQGAPSWEDKARNCISSRSLPPTATSPARGDISSVSSLVA
jgi:hypothetical protein